MKFWEEVDWVYKTGCEDKVLRQMVTFRSRQTYLAYTVSRKSLKVRILPKNLLRNQNFVKENEENGENDKLSDD